MDLAQRQRQHGRGHRGRPPEGVDRAAQFHITVQQAAGGPILYVEQLVGVRSDVLVTLSAFSAEVDTAVALLGVVTPVAMERALLGEPRDPEQPTFAQWIDFVGPVWVATRAQLSQIESGTTLPEYAEGLANFSHVVDDQLRWMVACPRPAERSDEVAEFIGLVETQQELIDGQQAAAAGLGLTG